MLRASAYTVTLYIISLSVFVHSYRFMSEEERVKNWHEKGNIWPPKWQPENELFRRAMEKREHDIMTIPAADERWENWVQFTSSRMVPRFTPTGYQIMQIPPAIYEKLKAALDEGLKNWNNLETEEHMDPLSTPLPNKFYDLGGLKWEVLGDMKELHQQWSGIELEPTSAYGVRIYQNGSSLAMHYDKIETHVISSIVHLGHEYEDENVPWSVEIENHNGETFSVNLEPGQMLLHESASCLHGSLKPFRGKYYASLFLHYRPSDTGLWNFTQEDVIENVPPHWSEGIVEIHGNRYAGAALTVDELAMESAPPRVVRPNLRGGILVIEEQNTSNLRGSVSSNEATNVKSSSAAKDQLVSNADIDSEVVAETESGATGSSLHGAGNIKSHYRMAGDPSSTTPSDGVIFVNRASGLRGT